MKTPIGDPEYFDNFDPLDAVIAAWCEPGPNPVWHERASSTSGVRCRSSPARSTEQPGRRSDE